MSYGCVFCNAVEKGGDEAFLGVPEISVSNAHKVKYVTLKKPNFFRLFCERMKDKVAVFYILSILSIKFSL